MRMKILDDRMKSIEKWIAESRELDLPDIYDVVMKYKGDVPRHVLVELLEKMGRPKIKDSERNKKSTLDLLYVINEFNDAINLTSTSESVSQRQVIKQTLENIKTPEKLIDPEDPKDPIDPIEPKKLTSYEMAYCPSKEEFDEVEFLISYKQILRDFKKYKYYK